MFIFLFNIFNHRDNSHNNNGKDRVYKRHLRNFYNLSRLFRCFFLYNHLLLYLMRTLYNVEVYLRGGFGYIIFTLDNAEVGYETQNFGYIGKKEQDEILVIYTVRTQLSKF